MAEKRGPTIGQRVLQYGAFNFEERPRLKIGDFVDDGGNRAIVLGVGLIDYAPDGPTYEVAEIEFREDGRRKIAFAVDLEDWEDDDGS